MKGSRYRILIILATVPAFLFAILVPHTPQATAAPITTPQVRPKALLPDLQTLPPYDLRLYVQEGGQRKIIRFSNSIWNRGPGTLELLGRRDPEFGNIEIRQLVYRVDGSFEEYAMGEFAFHPEHEHWHWKNFSRYEVWSTQPDGALSRLLVSSNKVGYCLRDDERMLSDPQGTFTLGKELVRERPTFRGCGWQRQGMSVGWRDTYDFDTGGQFVDISFLLDGIYALKSTVDPDNLLKELDRGNNVGVRYFAIYGNRLVVFEKFPHLEPDPRGNWNPRQGR